MFDQDYFLSKFYCKKSLSVLNLIRELVYAIHMLFVRKNSCFFPQSMRAYRVP